ncbi:MAG TPA: DUF255 domain-containing protein [Lacunisphaera sp.]|nr:DUF255 domain-containing protein [Lacunisphaera sp.]
MKLTLPFALVLAFAPLAPGAIHWEPWSDDVFARARRENKFVLLDLEAVWCHWCHVMEETTYQDPAVLALVGERYIAVRVDQDSRPDLANRYEDYGWPATVVFAPDGTEIVKKQGYIQPPRMAAMLRGIIADPTPLQAEEPPAGGGAPGDAAALRAQLYRGYDDQAGGWGFSHKFLDWDAVEFALREAGRGDRGAEEKARATLRLQRKLLDPVWGGMYQYSVGGNWDEPHFEKIMQMQAENIRIYSLAYARWGDADHLATAQAIHRYLRNFLTSPDGVVYASQDADLVPGEHSADYYALDDAARRARGVPRVDRHVYARENGWVIAALVQLAEVTGDTAYRVEAERAARWILAHRALPGGGFRHDEADPSGPYLGDTLAMGRAFLALHQLTQQPEWRERAVEAAAFIRAHFVRGDRPGYATADSGRSSFPEPRPQYDENVGVARFAVALAQVTGKPEHRAVAEPALRWILSPEVTAGRGFYVGGALLAAEEAATDPVHVLVLGAKDEPAARAMFAAALRLPDQHKLVEWWDRREGPPPRGEDIFPEMDEAAAFLCANGACSLPITTAAVLERRLAAIGRR